MTLETVQNYLCFYVKNIAMYFAARLVCVFLINKIASFTTNVFITSNNEFIYLFIYLYNIYRGIHN